MRPSPTAADGPSPREQEHALSSCVAQLEVLYRDREEARTAEAAERARLDESLASLTARAAALRAERDALREILATRRTEQERVRRRAQRLIDDLVGHVLVDPDGGPA
jgi:molecular chaperone GrpE (heat shock protein)